MLQGLFYYIVYSTLDAEESGKDWTLFMRNVDELLQSASTDFRMAVDEAR